MSKLILIAGIIVIIGGGIFFLLQSNQESQPADDMVHQDEEAMMEGEGAMMEGEKIEEEGMMPPSLEISEGQGMEKHVVVYSDSGYTPKELTIKKGDTIMFKNESSRITWPATDIHPQHREYPGSGIEQCNTPTPAIIFDACRDLKQGEEWSFQFNEVGEWRYHDHKRSAITGTITVEE
jgi:plastocyanin